MSSFRLISYFRGFQQVSRRFPSVSIPDGSSVCPCRCSCSICAVSLRVGVRRFSSFHRDSESSSLSVSTSYGGSGSGSGSGSGPWPVTGGGAVEDRVREQEELAQAESRHSGGLSASNPESQISSRQPKPVKAERKMQLMHEDFDGKDSLQAALEEAK